MDVREHFIQSGDGSHLAVFTAGPRGAPVLLLANGLGGNIIAWRHLVDHFKTRFRVVSWDYRGLYHSPRPVVGDDAAFAMPKHCEDLQAVLASEGAEQAVFLGWSMGVQVNFEYYRRHPEQFLGLVQINGTYGSPFETAFRSGWMRDVAPYFLGLMEESTPVMHAAAPISHRLGLAVTLFKSLGFVSPTLDEDVFRDLAGEYMLLDFDAYARTFRGLSGHNARDLLPSVTIPTLVITGEKDLFTPLEVSRHMATTIEGAELLVVRGGTHYTPV